MIWSEVIAYQCNGYSILHNTSTAGPVSRKFNNDMILIAYSNSKILVWSKQTWGNAAIRRALSLRRAIVPPWTFVWSWETPSCNIKSSSTGFLFGGGVTWKALIGFPLPWCFCQNMQTAADTKAHGKMYQTQPLGSQSEASVQERK